jgi:hypothetical protein
MEPVLLTGEARIDAPDSRTAIWVMPTNEELIVARQAAEFLRSGQQATGNRSDPGCETMGNRHWAIGNRQ